MPMTDANTLRRKSLLLVARFGWLTLILWGLAAAGCGSTPADDASSSPPIETRELDASQTQRTMQPLD